MSNKTIIDVGVVTPIPKDEYSATVAYERLNIVSFNGSSYMAKQNTTGHLPTDTTYWMLLAKKGDQGPDVAVATNEPTPSTIMRRDGAGRVRAEDPVHDKDVANKGYVDDSINSKGVVSSWVSSDRLGWYRKWSDGFIEQGGWIPENTETHTVVTLHTPFTTDTYTISATLGKKAGEGTYPRLDPFPLVVDHPKKTGFNIAAKPTTGTIFTPYLYWRTCGY